MSAVCHKCTLKITKEKSPGLKCGGSCDHLFHITCAGISKQLWEGVKNRSANWLCQVCRSTANHSLVDIDEDAADSDTINLQDIWNQLKRMEGQLAGFDEIKKEVKIIKSENNFLKEKVQKLEGHINKLDGDITLNLAKINNLEAICDKPHIVLNQASVVIKGLPLQHDDNVGVIINTFKKIGSIVSRDDITSVIPVKRHTNSNKTNSRISHLSSYHYFIVKLTSREIKESVLTLMRKAKILTTADLDVSLPQSHPVQRIYIMQHFTALQSKLYREAKTLKTNYQYKFLWVKDGQIYLRKNTDAEVYRIQSFNDIFRIKSLHAATQKDVITPAVHEDESV